MSFQKLLHTIKTNRLPVDPVLLELAYDFAREPHKGMKRKNGEPYINHPLRTATLLAELKLDEKTIIAGLLHDVPEDTTKTLKEIEKDFGEEVAKLVEGITKLGTIKYRGIARYAENLRKMFIAMALDIRTIFIKFADRIDNLETLSALPPHKRERIAKESLEIYAPIANRLGIGLLKGRLEDLAFPYVFPKEYKKTLQLLKEEHSERKTCLKVLRHQITSILRDNNIEFISVHGRTKHLYSLFKKLERYDNDMNRIYDIIALRIVVKTIEDCYKVLGIIHAEYKPLIGRIKDYIAQPKPNGYKSLHTTVFAKDGHIVEFQIRTEQMHIETEYGIAAHWYYEETESLTNTDKRLEWVEELAKWQAELGEIKDTKKYLETLKIDVFQNRIFVFTPDGDVIDLPEESTVVDFAYHIHTEVGDHCTSAKVNGKIVPLNFKLKSGDMAEIIVDKNRKGPNPDWLKFVKTGTARTKIRSQAEKRSWFKFPFIGNKG